MTEKAHYVIIETSALVQHRLGFDALTALYKDLLPVLTVEWIREGDHQAAVAAVLAARRRRLSLVDCTSFQVMRRLGIDTAFAFGRHFKEQGFTVLPR